MSDGPYTYDAVVIGAGPGGNAAAEAIAHGGGRACLVERNRLGGTCLNVGCMPTKAMLAAADLYHQARQAGRLGLSLSREGVDGRAFMARVHGVIETLQESIQSKLAGTEGIRRSASVRVTAYGRFVPGRSCWPWARDPTGPTYFPGRRNG
jgi:pyruvate/2-oxoglutarate dehydrogenase complex dihydrolipoamide dehydrogenase (E3) component